MSPNYYSVMNLKHFSTDSEQANEDCNLRTWSELSWSSGYVTNWCKNVGLSTPDWCQKKYRCPQCPRGWAHIQRGHEALGFYRSNNDKDHVVDAIETGSSGYNAWTRKRGHVLRRNRSYSGSLSGRITYIGSKHQKNAMHEFPRKRPWCLSMIFPRFLFHAHYPREYLCTLQWPGWPL